MELEEIKKLADLARIEMNEEEMKEIAKDFDSILAYVDQIKEVANLIPKDNSEKIDQFPELINVMREDEITNSSGNYSEKIIKEMPETENGYLKVRQIL
jgi:aspartyl-tRNA(Asn)/glutamyl-tRNA(Gln) amidotransferase subunit C